ncbi:MAG TPA: glycosyltransferase family 39 protein [bacterium]|nr:glycosyltransferase family 39 protein [bacterium]
MLNFWEESGLDGAALALLLMIASLGLGAALRRGDSLRDRLEQTALGLALWALLRLALCQASMCLYDLGFRAEHLLTYAMAPFVVYGLWTLRHSGQALAAAGPYDRFEAFAAIVIVLLTGASFLASLGPELEPDALSYHLPVAWDAGYLSDFINSWNYPTGYPLLAEYAFGALTEFHRTEAARVLHWLTTLLAIAATALLARRAGDRRAGWLAATILAGVPLVAWTSQTANTDGFAMLYFALAVLRLDDHLRSGARGDLLTAALFAGLCASTKLWNLMLIPLLAVVVVPFWLRVRRGQQRPGLFYSLGQAALFCLTALLVYAPWALRAWYHTGDPLYPLLSAWTADESTAAFFQYIAQRVRETYGAGFDLKAMLLLGWNLTFKPELFGHLPLGWLLLPLLTFGLVRLRHYPLLYLLTPLAAVSLAVWFVTSQQVRYLAPWLVYGAALAALPVAEAARKKAAVAWVVVALALTGWGPLIAAQWPRAGFTPHIYWTQLTGLQTRDEIRAAHAYNDEWSLNRMVDTRARHFNFIIGDGAQAMYWWLYDGFADVNYAPHLYETILKPRRENRPLSPWEDTIITTTAHEAEYVAGEGRRLDRLYTNGHLVLLANRSDDEPVDIWPLTDYEPYRWLEVAGPRDAKGYWWIGERARLMLPPGERQLHFIAPFLAQGVDELRITIDDEPPVAYRLADQTDVTLNVPPGAVIEFLPNRTVDPLALGYTGDPAPKAFLVKLSETR